MIARVALPVLDAIIFEFKKVHLAEYIKSSPELLQALDGNAREARTSAIFADVNSIFREIRDNRKRSKTSEVAKLREEVHQQRLMLAQVLAEKRGPAVTQPVTLPHIATPPELNVPGPAVPVKVVRKTTQNRQLDMVQKPLEIDESIPDESTREGTME